NRVAAVRAYYERPAQNCSVLKIDRSRLPMGYDGKDVLVDYLQAGKVASALLERIDQITVLDVVAEGIQRDFTRLKLDFRSAPQPACVVDDAHDLDRCRPCGTKRPDAEHFECCDGTAKKGGRAIVRSGQRLSRENRRNAASCERECSCQSYGPAAHHDGYMATAVWFRHQTGRSGSALTRTSTRRVGSEPRPTVAIPLRHHLGYARG